MFGHLIDEAKICAGERPPVIRIRPLTIDFSPKAETVRHGARNAETALPEIALAGAGIDRIATPAE